MAERSFCAALLLILLLVLLSLLPPEPGRESLEEGASRAMMLDFLKQVHLQKEVGAGCRKDMC